MTWLLFGEIEIGPLTQLYLTNSETGEVFKCNASAAVDVIKLARVIAPTLERLGMASFELSDAVARLNSEGS